MKSLPILGLVAAIAVAAPEVAEAGPLPVGSSMSSLAAPLAGVEQVRLICGPYRCVRRFGWRYGYGYGFRPWRFGYRRFGYGGLGFRRFGQRRF